MYWTSSLGGAVLSAPVGGGPFTIVANAVQPGPIATDASFVYWSEAGAVKRLPLGADAGAPVVLGAQTCEELGVDASRLYCVGRVGNSYVFAVLDKTTGAVIDQYVDDHWRFAFAQNSGHAFWMQSIVFVRLFAYAKGASFDGQWAQFQTAWPSSLAADECAIYYTANDAGVWKLEFRAQTPSPLTQSATAAGRLAVEGNSVYWVDSGFIGKVRR